MPDDTHDLAAQTRAGARDQQLAAFVERFRAAPPNTAVEVPAGVDIRAALKAIEEARDAR